VSSAKLATASVVAGKIANFGVSATDQLADTIVATAKIIDLAVTTAKINDDAVTAPKISHDNKRTKILVTFEQTSNVASTWGKHHGQTLDASMPGIPIPRAGSVTAVNAKNSDGSATSATHAYGTHTFTAGDVLGIQEGASAWKIMKNGSQLFTLSDAGSRPGLITLELEFDD
jgi:hypothetical protein